MQKKQTKKKKQKQTNCGDKALYKEKWLSSLRTVRNLPRKFSQLFIQPKLVELVGKGLHHLNILFIAVSIKHIHIYSLSLSMSLSL